MRYTPQGTAVCTLGLATNRSWTTESGEKKEEVEFHRLVVWNKLAELCAQLLFKGRRIYIEGRLQTRSWTTQEGTERQVTEIVINDMMILDSRRQTEEGVAPEDILAKEETPATIEVKAATATTEVPASQPTPAPAKTKKKEEASEEKKEEVLTAEDIPF